MKILFLIIFSIFLSACNYQAKDKTVKPKKDDSITVDTIKKISETNDDSTKHIDIGYDDIYDKLPKLIFDTISEIEFNRLNPEKFINEVETEQKGDYFYIQTNNNKWTD